MIEIRHNDLLQFFFFFYSIKKIFISGLVACECCVFCANLLIFTSFPYSRVTHIYYKFLYRYFYWAFSYKLITILRTGSGLELSPLCAACWKAWLLHRRIVTSSYGYPQQTHCSADIEILSAFVIEAETPRTIPQFWSPDSWDYRSELILLVTI